MTLILRGLLGSILSILAFSTAQAVTRASFLISFDNVSTDLPIITTSVMPSEGLTIRTTASASANVGKLIKSGQGWEWAAPAKPGLYSLQFEKNDEKILLYIFVLTPHDTKLATQLNGYNIGQYRQSLFKGLSAYAPTSGFIDLSHGPADLKISPHFTLGQFICKQQPGHEPTYLLIRPETLIKLETLLEAANEKGWYGETFHIMSGYRTPFYNRSIGNQTSSSRHLYGGAADIWIDGDGDGQMDDLNNDGLINKDDARELGRLAEQIAKKGGRNWPQGGIGIYGPNTVRGPFVHIDSRGYKARWGW